MFAPAWPFWRFDLASQVGGEAGAGEQIDEPRRVHVRHGACEFMLHRGVIVGLLEPPDERLDHRRQRRIRLITQFLDEPIYRGFGFAELISSEDAQVAVDALNNREAGGRAIRVEIAQVREPR
ncbi:MAG: hypothetical protein ACREQX_08095 [Candidatus Binataceae bacterium]